MIKIPQFVQDLVPYKAGKPIDELAREQNLSKIVKLASAENPVGPSPMAVIAIRKALMDLNRYPDPSSFDLVAAISKKYGVEANHVICGHGTDSLLAYIVSAFTTERDEIITSEGTFIGIYVTVQKTGRHLVRVPMKDYGFDLDAILKRITDRTTMIYLVNPNNPTGSMFSRNAFESFMEKVPKHIMVILDEAYTIYAEEHPEYPNGVSYDFENMVVTRTFSKAYGLAGLRVGAAIGPDKVIEALYKVKLPFEPSLLAQRAAGAALDDDDFLNITTQLNKASLAMFKACFDRCGIEQVPSFTNFILTLFPDEKLAASFTADCLNRGLIIRHVNTFGIPNGVRINSGTMEETEFAVKVIEEVYGKMMG